MRLIRIVLAKILLTIDNLTAPKVLIRDVLSQEKIDKDTSGMILYQLEGCPFCIKVRRVIRRLGLKIKLREVSENINYKNELILGGGKFQVPCLRIAHDNGSVEWLYESSDITSYLKTKSAI